MMNGRGPVLDDRIADLVRMRVVEVVPSAHQVVEVQDPRGRMAIAMIVAHVMMLAEVAVPSDLQVEEVDLRDRMAIAKIAAVMIGDHARILAEVGVLHDLQAEEVTDQSGPMPIAMIGAAKAVPIGPVVPLDHGDQEPTTAMMHRAAHVQRVRVLIGERAVRRSRGRRKVAMSASSRKAIH